MFEQSVNMRRKLFNSGHGSRVNLINAELDLAKNKGAITEAEVSKEQAIASIEETKNQILEIDITERGKALDELDKTSGELAEVRENIARLEDKVTRLELRAPVSGVVHGLEINTPGSVVQPAQVVMEIIPADEQVVIENKIQPKDIGHIEIGQSTKVTITGFDARRYGTVEGELINFSPTTFTDEKGKSLFSWTYPLERRLLVGKWHQTQNRTGHDSASKYYYRGTNLIGVSNTSCLRVIAQCI